MTMNEIQKRAKTYENLFEQAPMKKTFQMEVSYDENGDATFTMPYQEKFNHGLGSTHGGVLATILDNAGWFTAATRYDYWIVTTDLHIQMLNPVTGSGLKATGKLTKAGKRMAFTTMELWDDNENIIATGTGSFAVMDQKIHS